MAVPALGKTGMPLADVTLAPERSRDAEETARPIATAHERVVDNPPWLFIIHDLNPRAISRRVIGFTPAQSWFQDLVPVDIQEAAPALR